MRANSLLAAAVLLCSLANCLPHVENAPRDVDSVAQVDTSDEDSDLLTSDAGGPTKGGGAGSSGGGESLVSFLYISRKGLVLAPRSLSPAQGYVAELLQVEAVEDRAEEVEVGVVAVQVEQAVSSTRLLHMSSSVSLIFFAALLLLALSLRRNILLTCLRRWRWEIKRRKWWWWWWWYVVT